jgi:DNA-binding MarR family transcriptional regulator
MEAGRKTKLRVLSGFGVPDEQRGHAAMIKLVRVFGRFNERVSRMAKSHGLSLSHLESLLCLTQEEGISQQDLAERLLFTKGNICVIVQKLEAAQLIERRSDPDDQRYHRLYLTPGGREKVREFMPGHLVETGRILKNLTMAEQKTLHELLCRIDDTFNEDEE